MEEKKLPAQLVRWGKRQICRGLLLLQLATLLHALLGSLWMWRLRRASRVSQVFIKKLQVTRTAKHALLAASEHPLGVLRWAHARLALLGFILQLLARPSARAAANILSHLFMVHPPLQGVLVRLDIRAQDRNACSPLRSRAHFSSIIQLFLAQITSYL